MELHVTLVKCAYAHGLAAQDHICPCPCLGLRMGDPGEGQGSWAVSQRRRNSAGC